MGYESISLGHEKNVLIESTLSDAIIYLDHDIHDHFNEVFLLSQPTKTEHSIKRAFVSDIYGIIDGVTHGLGRGVVPVHMLKNKLGIRKVKGYQPLNTPCLLQFSKEQHQSN